MLAGYSTVEAMADLGVVVSSSLLQWDGPLTRSKDSHSCFQLGLGDWMESKDDKENATPNEEPRRKKEKLDEVSKQHWKFLTEAADDNLGKKHVAKNTSKPTNGHTVTSWRGN